VSDRETVVPEPEVKARLRRLGVAVPNGVVGATLPNASSLRAPLVMKAFGPGIVHKTHLGAVRLGLDHTDLEAAAADMRARLPISGFLVEEQLDVESGIEVIIGVSRREPFGLVVALGLGGTLTELLDLVALALFPLTRDDAVDLVARFPGADALAGRRGGSPLARDRLVEVLLALAGTDGLAAESGDRLADLECNPVLVMEKDAVALDARLLLREAPAPVETPRPTDFTRLFAPHAIAVAGASTNRSGFGNRALAAYRAAGWSEHLYALHPQASEVDGVPAVADLGELDDPVDYLLVAVPAPRCADVVRATAGRVPFVHVISGGFDEVGSDGAALGRELVRAARDVKTRVIGPNCIGVYSPAGRQTFQLNAPDAPGGIAIVSQSGGLSGDIINLGSKRGVRFSKALSIGNAVDVTPAEVVGWLVDDPDTSAIGLYLEGASGAEGLVETLRYARGRCSVVLLVGGETTQGGAAASSHTGALATEPRAWAAVARSTDTALVDTLEHFVGALAYAQRWAAAPRLGHGVLVVGPGGGASVLATDACDRAGLTLAPTTPRARALLEGMGFGAGTSVANPLEIPFGPAVPQDALRTVLTPLLREQAFADVLVHVNVSAYFGYGTAGTAPLVEQLKDLAVADVGDARLAVVLRNLAVAPGEEAETLVGAASDAGLVTFATLEEAASAIAAMAQFTRAQR
jgi:acyl-CoA synthetase (NDP forming)